MGRGSASVLCGEEGPRSGSSIGTLSNETKPNQPSVPERRNGTRGTSAPVASLLRVVCSRLSSKALLVGARRTHAMALTRFNRGS